MSMTNLDHNQVIRTVFDDVSGSLKTQLVAGVASEIEVAASDGDSIMAVGTVDGSISGTQKVIKVGSDGGIVQHELASSGSLTSSYVSTTDLVAEVSAEGLSKFQVFSKTTTIIVGSQVCTIQISPTDSGDVWFDTSATITPSLGLNGLQSSSVVEVLARRVRVRAAAAVTSGVAAIYLVGKR